MPYEQADLYQLYHVSHRICPILRADCVPLFIGLHKCLSSQRKWVSVSVQATVQYCVPFQRMIKILDISDLRVACRSLLVVEVN